MQSFWRAVPQADLDFICGPVMHDSIDVAQDGCSLCAFCKFASV